MDSVLKTHMAPPLSLLVLGALTPERHNVELADENVEHVRLDDRPDLVGITVKVDTAPRSFAIADAYRRRGVAVVLGGVHVSACPDPCRQHADAIVIGEADNLWPKLLEDRAAGRLQSIYENDQPPELDHTPIPRWDMLAGKNYLYTNTLTVSRGCPWQCEFCYNSVPAVASRFRTKPIDRIIREIESLNARHVMFIDDNLAGDRRFCREFLDAIAPMGLTWHAAVSADIGRDVNLLDQMSEAGCQSLFIGFETIDPDNLVAAGKQQNVVDQYDQTIDRIHERGMMVNASIVLGFDRDGPEVFDATRDWLIDRRVESMTAHILTPYPATVLHRRLSAQGRIIDHDFSHYTTARAVFQPARMSPAELEQGYRRLYRQFYSWSSILRRVPVHPRQRRAYWLFNLLYRKYGRFTGLLGRAKLMGEIGRWARRRSYPGTPARTSASTAGIAHRRSARVGPVKSLAGRSARNRDAGG